MAGREPSPDRRHLAAHFQKRFGRIFRHIRGSAGRSALLRMDRRPEAAARRIVLAAKIHATAAPEWLVENQYATRGKADAGEADEASWARRDRSGEKRWPLGSGLRFAEQIDHSR